MTDRYFLNQFPDYDPNQDINRDGGYTIYRELLETHGNRLLAMLEDGVSKTGDAGDESVYTGVGGHGLLYFFLLKQYSNAPTAQNLQEKAIYYTNRSVSLSGNGRPTFLCGDVGSFSLEAVLSNFLGDHASAEKIIRQKIIPMVSTVTNPRSKVPNEILYGRAGFLYSLLWLKQEIPSSSTVITDSIIRQVITSILEAGQRTRSEMRGQEHPPLFYFWHDSPYVGAAHGFYGILYMLLVCRRLLTQEELVGLVQPTLDYLLGIRFRSGNTPSSVGREHDKLIHWCHGAPGVVYTLTQVSMSLLLFLINIESCSIR